MVRQSREEVTQLISRHLDGVWPRARHEDFVWTLGPISKTLPNLRIRRIAPTKGSDPWVYVTVGAWEATGDEAHGTEFLLLSPIEDPRHVELLAMVANLHADASFRLETGRVVEIGRPWIDHAQADHLLVALPYPFGPSLENLITTERHIRFLWLVPITGAEAQLAREHGLERLEGLLENGKVNVISAARPSLV